MSGTDVEIRLTVEFLHRPGQHVPTQAEVEGQAPGYPPIILPIKAEFPVTGLGVAEYRTLLVLTYETNQKVRDVVARDGGGAGAVTAHVEKAFTGQRTKEVHLTAQNVGAKLHGVLALYPGQVIREL